MSRYRKEFIIFASLGSNHNFALCRYLSVEESFMLVSEYAGLLAIDICGILLKCKSRKFRAAKMFR